MDDFLFFLLTLAVALLFGAIGHKLRLPAGAMVGGILGAVIVNLTMDRAYFYADIKIVLQILSGVMIGSKIGKRDLLALRTILLPMLFLQLAMVALNLGIGFAVDHFSTLDLATALFSTAPGGMADMALISSDQGANTAYVGILQLIRILTIFIFMPVIFKRILTKGKTGGAGALPPPPTDNPEPQDAPAPPKLSPAAYAKRFAVLVAVATAGGLACHFLGMAAGALTGGMIASGALCVLRGTLPFPGKLRFFLQVFSGAFVGVGIDRACIATMPALLVPALIMIAGIFLFVFLASTLMRKLFRLDLGVCLLASTPGGVQEMSLLSEDLGCDTAKIAVMQSTRLMIVILLFPTMLKLILQFAA